MNIDRVDSGADVPDEGKWVRVEGWGGLEDARKEILDSVEMFRSAPEKPNF